MSRKLILSALCISAAGLGFIGCGDKGGDELAEAACDNVLACSSVEDQSLVDRDLLCSSLQYMREIVRDHGPKGCIGAVDDYLRCISEADCSEIDDACEAMMEHAEAVCEV